MSKPKAPKINLKDRLEDDELDLSMSDLQEVPVKDIAAVRKATKLDLSNNRLTSLGKNFATLAHIVKLDLSNNLLKELPENFGLLKRLKHLDLYSNQLSYLPLSFSELNSLRWLDVKNNPLVPALAQVAGPCLDAPQCQQCAKSVVGFFAQTKTRIEEERNRRAAQRQKTMESTGSANAANSKNENKKNKKAKNDKNTQSSKSENNVAKQPKQQTNNQPKVKPVKSKKAKGKGAKKSSLLKKIFMTLLFSLIFGATAVYVLSVKDPVTFDLLKNTTINSYGKLHESLPPQVSGAINKTVEISKPTVMFLQEKITEGAGKVVELKNALHKNEHFKTFVKQLNAFWDVIYIKINEMYRTVYVSLTDSTTKTK